MPSTIARPTSATASVSVNYLGQFPDRPTARRYEDLITRFVPTSVCTNSNRQDCFYPGAIIRTVHMEEAI